MTNPENQVKQDTQVTIQRGRHSKENPFVMISKQMLRDRDLSPRSKGILCYMLSLPDDWKTHPRQVAECLGVSKNMVYAALSEMIHLGYAAKTEQKNEKGCFSGVLYEFFEERVIKEKSTVSQKPDPENPDTEKRTLLIHTPKDTYLKDISNSLKVLPNAPVLANANEIEFSSISSASANQEAASLPAAPLHTASPIAASPTPPPAVTPAAEPAKRTRSPSDFPYKVKETAELMINAMVLIKPDYAPPRNLGAILTHVDFMIRLDNRNPDTLMDVFRWALADSFWADKMFKPNPAKYLREKFDQLQMKMNAKPPAPPKKERKFCPSSDDAKALEMMTEWRKNAV